MQFFFLIYNNENVDYQTEALKRSDHLCEIQRQHQQLSNCVS